jgi:hypothetical protein
VTVRRNHAATDIFGVAEPTERLGLQLRELGLAGENQALLVF